MSVVRVEKELHIPAPCQGVAVYSQNPSYASLEKPWVVESVKEETFLRGKYFDRRIYRRLSRDHGKTWEEQPFFKSGPEGPFDTSHWLSTPMHFLDPDNGLLLALYCSHKTSPDDRQFGAVETPSRTCRFHWQISRDAGLTWEPGRPLVQSGKEYDETHWARDIAYGRNCGQSDLSPILKATDGTILHGFSMRPLDEAGNLLSPCGCYYYQVGCLRGRWRKDLSGLDWEVGDYVSVPPNQSAVGCCEPAMALLNDSDVLMVMRCQGNKKLGIPSLKFMTVSRDLGRTWDTPRPVTFDDGTVVNSPASLSSLFVSSKNGRLYWIANILDEPSYDQRPRYPLVLAEMDRETLRVRREGMTVIDTWKEGQPKDVRYTNWGFYQERGTGDLILHMVEEPKISWDDLTSDCYRYRVHLP